MFLLRPRPLPFESLSSWRQRGGLANGFWRFPVFSKSWKAIDPDRLPNEEEIRWLADQFHVDQLAIRRLSLDSWLEPIQANAYFSGQSRWVTALGSKTAAPDQGPTCCIECLRNDPEPYFRIHWRYSFLTHCPIHHTLMIDQCPSCGDPLWPSAAKVVTRKKTCLNLAICPTCSFDLRDIKLEARAPSSQSSVLWTAISTGTVPVFFTQASSLPDFFDGLWVICQLLLRRQSQRVIDQLPPELQPKDIPDGKGHFTVESLDIPLRSALIDASIWLMSEWPNRFVEICKRANISKTHFLSTSAISPSWLSAEINQQLVRHNRAVTPERVMNAVETLQESGDRISKSAVRRMLEVSESKAISNVFFRRNHARIDELLTLLKKFERQLATATTSRDQRSTLLRDYLSFLLCVMTQQSVEKVCTFTEKEVSDSIYCSRSPDDAPNEVLQLLLGRARSLNEEYAHSIRAQLIGMSPAPSEWFVGRQGTSLAGHSIRERIAKLMRTDFPSDLWNSCDAFIYVLGAPPLGRRAQAQIDKFSPTSSPNQIERVTCTKRSAVGELHAIAQDQLPKLGATLELDAIDERKQLCLSKKP